MIDSIPILSDLIKLHFQGKYSTHPEASRTHKIIKEYASLDEGEKQQLSQWRSVLRTNLSNEAVAEKVVQKKQYDYPSITLRDLQNETDEMFDLACLSSMVEKSAHLQNVRLVAWLSERVRGFNDDLQMRAYSYLIWAIAVRQAMKETPPDIVSHWNLDSFPLTSDVSKEVQLLEHIAYIATVDPIKESEFEDRIGRLQSGQVTTLLNDAVSLMDRRQRLVELNVFNLLIETCMESHLNEVRVIAYQLSQYPRFFSLCRGYLFLGAEPRTRDRLLNHLKTTTNLDQLLRVLAWVGDQEVARTLTDLDRDSSWKDVLHVPPSSYATEAGWYIGTQGERVNLCQSQSYRLKQVEDKAEADIAIGASDSLRCPSCKNQLVTILKAETINKYFPFQLQPVYRVLYCLECMDETVIDWDSLNINNKDDETDNVGQSRPTFFKVLSCEQSALPEWNSKIGGYPYWVQYTQYPTCPRCHRLMFFLAQFDYGDGLIYAFLCQDCHTTTSLYQCT